jgi:hypothetical protein
MNCIEYYKQEDQAKFWDCCHGDCSNYKSQIPASSVPREYSGQLDSIMWSLGSTGERTQNAPRVTTPHTHSCYSGPQSMRKNSCDNQNQIGSSQRPLHLVWSSWVVAVKQNQSLWASVQVSIHSVCNLTLFAICTNTFAYECLRNGIHTQTYYSCNRIQYTQLKIITVPVHSANCV